MGSIHFHRKKQQGVALIVVLILLVIVTVLGIGGARIALLGERSTRYDRDHQVAWESAEAALVEAEFDIANQTSTYFAARPHVFGYDSNSTDMSKFVSGCGTGAQNRGLCLASGTADPVWKTINFMDVSASAPSVEFGAMTGHQFAASLAGAQRGVQPAHPPRYIIEIVKDQRPGLDKGYKVLGDPEPKIYRITSIGFGPNEQVQIMMQSTFAKSSNP